MELIYSFLREVWVLKASGLLAMVLFAVLDGLSDAYIFRWIRQGIRGSRYVDQAVAEEAADYNTIWHRAQAARQAVMIGAVAVLAGDFSLLLLGAALFWLVHDVLVNLVGLERGWFYVGETAWIDKQFQRFPRPEVAMAVAKVAALIVGLIWFLT